MKGEWHESDNRMDFTANYHKRIYKIERKTHYL